jgi:ABC-type nitrate/sulfonate/bicarbonate transport system substrate-binding protein
VFPALFPLCNSHGAGVLGMIQQSNFGGGDRGLFPAQNEKQPERPRPQWARYADALLSAAVLILSAVGCRPETERQAQSTPLKITLAIQPAPYSSLIAVADEKGFFKEAGLEVKINSYPSGFDALTAMMRGEVQVSTVADIAFASKMNEDPSLRVITAIGTSSGSEIVARKDRNIREPADLRGKRVGYSPGTSSPYFLHSFLLIHHISRTDITAVAIPAERQAEAVVTGEVDAVSAFEVYAFAARKELGENAVAWDSQNTLGYQWLLVTRKSSTQSPEATKRLLKALIMAEEFAVNHGEETRSIIARKWNIDPELTRYTWGGTRLFVSLNQSIITAIQSYVKWNMADKGKTGDPPDVLMHIDARPMEEVDPRLVTIFR